MGIYEPAEDSYFLQKFVREYSLGRVLDMGTGSGIQALTSVTNPNAQQVLAVDADKMAVAALEQQRKQQKIRKLTVLHSDLFSQVSGKFNLIIFNPPYLPQDQGITDTAIYGGKKGWEISERFFQQVSGYLFPDGKILFLFSSHTDKKKIDEIIRTKLLLFTELEQQKISFETLYIYLIEKSALLRELEKKSIQQITYFTRGKRGEIYTGIIDKSQFIKSHLPPRKDLIHVAIKIKRSESQAIGMVNKEATWLQRVNEKGLGPRLIAAGNDFVVYEFVTGDFILDWIGKSTKQEIFKVIFHLLQQCFILDQMRITKEEMHHPHKHILVTRLQQPVLIDFERCHESTTPQNVTQLVEFIGRIRKELGEKGLMMNEQTLRSLSQAYKKDQTAENLQKIIKALSGP